jgi:uncharacterized cupredoxin-like copper-binding protein
MPVIDEIHQELAMKAAKALILLVAFAVSGPVAAHDKAPNRKTEKKQISTEEQAFGREGNPKKATRTVRIDMSDAMRFTPADVTVRRGETVRFDVRNNGKVMHEMVLGTMNELKEHAELMKKHPGMEHDEPYMAHVAPGKTERIVWQFTKPGEFHYGCLIPGHFEAGMVGRINVRAR